VRAQQEKERRIFELLQKNKKKERRVSALFPRPLVAVAVCADSLV
jgi:hypothetical protein